MFVYHRYHLAERLLSNEVKVDNQNIVGEPKRHVCKEHLLILPAHERQLDIAFAFLNISLFLFEKNPSKRIVLLESLQQPLTLLLVSNFSSPIIKLANSS